MTEGTKIVLFILVTAGIIWVSRSSLRNPQHHGFYRIFAWEAILVLFLRNVDSWFKDPLSLQQVVSWIFLILSLILIIQAVRLFRQLGQPDSTRNDPGLVGIEKTTQLVMTGVYRYIRHPFYSSLLLLGWGIMLKEVNWFSLFLALIISLLLVITAKKEEQENMVYFGEPYRAYMKDTKMFIPFLF